MKAKKEKIFNLIFFYFMLSLDYLIFLHTDRYLSVVFLLRDGGNCKYIRIQQSKDIFQTAMNFWKLNENYEDGIHLYIS